MQYVDKGSVVPPPFNLLPSGKYFIELCKRCYDRIKYQKVRQTLTLYNSTGVTLGQGYKKLHNAVYSRGESRSKIDQNLFERIVSIKTSLMY